MPPLCSARSTSSNSTEPPAHADRRAQAHPGEALSNAHEGIAFNEHDGAIIFKHAYALGCDGIVSKQLGSPYRSGRADCWVKVKNPTAPAANRLDEED